MPKVDEYSWKRNIQQKFNKMSKMPSGQIECSILIVQYKIMAARHALNMKIISKNNVCNMLIT